MALKLADSTLLKISKGSKQALADHKFGVWVHRQSGLAIDDLMLSACKDRFKLAAGFLRAARRALKPPSPQNRVALARGYYAMYHAARVVVYFSFGGDDHEEHSTLPGYLPKDFPDRGRWENDLKAARLDRNRADYDPYPKADKAFASAANGTVTNAGTFLPLVRKYLKSKGCTI